MNEKLNLLVCDKSEKSVKKKKEKIIIIDTNKKQIEILIKNKNKQTNIHTCRNSTEPTSTTFNKIYKNLKSQHPNPFKIVRLMQMKQHQHQQHQKQQ